MAAVWSSRSRKTSGMNGLRPSSCESGYGRWQPLPRRQEANSCRRVQELPVEAPNTHAAQQSVRRVPDTEPSDKAAFGPRAAARRGIATALRWCAMRILHQPRLTAVANLLCIA